MSSVYGKMELTVSQQVKAVSEELGILEANYKLDPSQFVKWQLIGVDFNGEVKIIDVDEVNSLILDEYVEA